MMNSISFSLLEDIFPGGHVEGGEYVVRNPTRNDRNSGSFRITLHDGRWRDHATGEYGQGIGNLAVAFIEQFATWARRTGWLPDGADALASIVGIAERANIECFAREPAMSPVPKPRPIVPVPAVAMLDALTFRHPQLGLPAALYPYFLPNGDLVGYLARWNLPGGKEVRPLAWCEPGAWRWRWWSPRPLFNLPRIIGHGDAPILVVEGEACVQSAARLFAGAVATTAPSGAAQPHLADWTPLAGRRVVIWPDHDEAGRACAETVERLARAAGAASVVRLAPETVATAIGRAGELPKGWDVADAEGEGLTPERASALLTAALGGAATEESPGRAYLTVADQARHFAGCVYVTDQHRVLVPDGRLLAPEQFRTEFGGHEFAMQADGARPTKNAFEAFTESRAHRFPKAKTSALLPDQPFGAIVAGTVNLYRRPPTPRTGDVTSFMDHLAYLIPNGRDRTMFLQWLGHVVQRPGRPARWAPVLVGPPGNGKSFIARCVVLAIGREYCHVVQPREIAATHNGWIHGKLFAQVEEIDSRDRRDMIEIIKPFITDERINVRAMRTDSATIANVLNWFFCTNHEGGIPKVAGDRRFAIFHTNPDVRPSDYYSCLYDWAEAGGFEHVADYLQSLDVGTMPNRAPDTSSTADAMRASLGNAELAVLDAIEEGRLGTRGGWLSSWIVARTIHDATGRPASLRTVGSVLNCLGYVEIMRSPVALIHEDGKRPKIYATEARPAILDHYLMAQGYSEFPLRVV